MLKANKLVKSYGDSTILNGLDFSLSASDRICLMGASGCGKTTFLRMMACLDIPDTGEILLDGKVVSSKFKTIDIKSNIWPSITLVFQELNLLPHLTCNENCALGSIDIDLRERISYFSNKLKVSHCLNRRPHQISRGEAQRIAIIRSLVRKPKYLLLDEPTSALDPNSREILSELLIEQTKENSLSILCVTHDINFAHLLHAKSYLLDGGSLKEININNI